MGLRQAHTRGVDGRENAGEWKQRERAGRQWACSRHTLGVWRAERMQVSGSSLRERGDGGPEVTGIRRDWVMKGATSSLELI